MAKRKVQYIWVEKIKTVGQSQNLVSQFNQKFYYTIQKIELFSRGDKKS